MADYQILQDEYHFVAFLHLPKRVLSVLSAPELNIIHQDWNPDGCKYANRTQWFLVVSSLKTKGLICCLTFKIYWIRLLLTRDMHLTNQLNDSTI